MKKQFSFRARLRSFVYAFKGIFYMFRTQHNSWIHAVITTAVVIFGIIYKINLTEWCLVTLAMGLVLGAEVFNTAIEKFVDFVSPEYNKEAGRIKDLMAGAVLITAIAAAATGLIIFIPKIF